MADSSPPGAVTLFRVAGIPIQFHFTFLFLAAIFAFSGIVGRREAVLDAAMIAAVFASVLLHELGHALTARHFGVKIVSITMYPIGGVARMASQTRPWEELWITAAGPAVNLALAAFISGAIKLMRLHGDLRQLAYEIAAANVALLLLTYCRPSQWTVDACFAPCSPCESRNGRRLESPQRLDEWSPF